MSAKFYQNQPGFVDDMTKKHLVWFLVRSSNCCSLTKHER